MIDDEYHQSLSSQSYCVVTNICQLNCPCFNFSQATQNLPQLPTENSFQAVDLLFLCVTLPFPNFNSCFFPQSPHTKQTDGRLLPSVLVSLFPRLFKELSCTKPSPEVPTWIMMTAQCSSGSLGFISSLSEPF